MAVLPVLGPVAVARAVAIAVIVAAIIGPQRHEVDRSVGTVAFDIGEIVERPAMGEAVSADLFVAQIHVAGGAGTVEMPGHVNEAHRRIVRFKLAHLIEILLDFGLRAVHLAAPGPDHHVGLRMSGQIGPRGRRPGRAVRTAEIIGPRKWRVAQIQRPRSAAVVEREQIV
jgi:hypothetical protein